MVFFCHHYITDLSILLNPITSCHAIMSEESENNSAQATKEIPSNEGDNLTSTGSYKTFTQHIG